LRWFTRADPVTQDAAPRAHRSLALSGLVQSLRPQTRPEVLDLGPPLTGNIRFLSALQCRVRVGDLQRSLAAESVESRRPEAIAQLLERLLPLAADERFAAVLAWDVLDYLRSDQATALMARLLPRLRPGAHVLLLVSTHAQIPAFPTRYRILDGESLEQEPHPQAASQPTRPGPRYRQSDLEQMMPGLAVRRCYLLRSGIQEYLLAHA
jgi:hypothetical protein